MKHAAHPILSCQASAALEAQLLGDDTDKTRAAMQQAGDGVGTCILRDFNERTILPRNPKVLVLAGKGHNGGDALYAAETILKARPRGSITVLLPWPETECKPLTAEILGKLKERPEVQVIEYNNNAHQLLEELTADKDFDMCIDGILGMSFKAPLQEHIEKLIEAVNNSSSIQFKAAVDIPSGISDTTPTIALKANFTYATGIAKAPLFEAQNRGYVGRIRYVDIDFFRESIDKHYAPHPHILTEHTLEPLRQLRPSDCNKRTFGHLFIMGGSQGMPGALMMTIKAALRSGVGLVTVFAPRSIINSGAAQIPEAMWVPCDENEDGFLIQQSIFPLLKRIHEATALLIGPGLGPDTQGLVIDILRSVEVPTLLDADALQRDVALTIEELENRSHPILLTPHWGEFKRLCGNPDLEWDPQILKAFCKSHGVDTLLKGPVSYISDGESIHCSTYGGPVLARGGSGDILAGVTGGLLAQPELTQNPFKVLSMGAAWHGLAADHLARAYGHRAVVATDLIHFLDDVLRMDW